MWPKPNMAPYIPDFAPYTELSLALWGPLEESLLEEAFKLVSGRGEGPSTKW